MPERKAWTIEEDKALKEIVSKGVKKWTIVSKTMERQFAIFGRTGKQCRQRWFNQLDPNINSANWSQEEQKLLYKLHNQLGNSWSKISIILKGRTDNQVKNHFYSTIRKSFRRLNRHILDSKSQKELKSIILTKLLSAAEDKFDRKLKLTDDVIQKSIDLKNRLMLLAYDIEQSKENVNDMNSLIKQLGDFTKTWKRKKKKGKKETPTFQEGEDDSLDLIESSMEEIKKIVKRKSQKQQVSKKNSKQTKHEVKKQKEQKEDDRQSRQGFTLVQRRSSRVVSVNGSNSGAIGSIDQSLPLQRLSSAFSFHQSEEDLMPLRKRSSSRSSFSMFGGNGYARFSDFEVPCIGFSLTDSQNNITINNLFQFPAMQLLQRLDD